MIHDATKDGRFASHPYVKGEPYIRFYAGAPLVASNGHRLGTMCGCACSAIGWLPGCDKHSAWTNFSRLLIHTTKFPLCPAADSILFALLTLPASSYRVTPTSQDIQTCCFSNCLFAPHRVCINSSHCFQR